MLTYFPIVKITNPGFTFSGEPRIFQFEIEALFSAIFITALAVSRTAVFIFLLFLNG